MVGLLMLKLWALVKWPCTCRESRKLYEQATLMAMKFRPTCFCWRSATTACRDTVAIDGTPEKINKGINEGIEGHALDCLCVDEGKKAMLNAISLGYQYHEL